MREQILRTRITELFGIKHPILCGGLQWLADARYVAAVVNAGGMGFITALSFPDDPQAFRREVIKCRELTHGKPFGVSLPISRRLGNNERLNPYLDVIEQEGVRFIETSGDSPALFLPRLKGAGCIVIHKVPVVKYAESAQKLPVDAITVIGAEAGGHPGQMMVGSIVQGVLAANAVTKPLALGGGMGTGRHLVSAMAMGADAILLGSRMVVAEEIWAHRRYKEHISTIGALDSHVVMGTFHRNHRVLRNRASEKVAALEASGSNNYADYEALTAGEQTRQAYEDGDFARGMIDMGPAGAFADKVIPVEAIFDELIDDALQAISRVQSKIMSPTLWPLR
jgi:NADH:quinone reductase (non-electrogenic)